LTEKNYMYNVYYSMYTIVLLEKKYYVQVLIKYFILNKKICVWLYLIYDMSNNRHIIGQWIRVAKLKSWNYWCISYKGPATERLSIIQSRLNNPFLQANGLHELRVVVPRNCDSLQLSRFVPETIVGRVRRSKCSFAYSLETHEKEGLVHVGRWA